MLKFWSICPGTINNSLFVFRWNLLVQYCICLDSTLYDSVDVHWNKMEWREAGIIIYECDPLLSSSCLKFLIRRRKAIMRENSHTSGEALPTVSIRTVTKIFENIKDKTKQLSQSCTFKSLFMGLFLSEHFLNTINV